jgi:hypothetical protein
MKSTLLDFTTLYMVTKKYFQTMKTLFLRLMNDTVCTQDRNSSNSFARQHDTKGSHKLYNISFSHINNNVIFYNGFYTIVVTEKKIVDQTTMVNLLLKGIPN